MTNSGKTGTREAPRRGGTQALARSLQKVTRRLYRRRGFAQSEVLTHWPAIVGPLLAAHSAPERLRWPTAPDDSRGATLRVRVASAWAVQLAHLEPVVIDRINAYFGYRAVARLQLVQGHIPAPAQPAAARERNLEATEEQRLQQLLAEIEDPELRAALAELGRSVLSAKAARPRTDPAA
jgi:hypothetical protein